MSLSYDDIIGCTIEEALGKIKSARQPKPFGEMTVNDITNDMCRNGTWCIYGVYFFLYGEELTPIYIGQTSSWDFLNRCVQHVRISAGGHSEEAKNKLRKSYVSFLVAGRDWNASMHCETLFISYCKPEINKQKKNSPAGTEFAQAGNRFA